MGETRITEKFIKQMLKNFPSDLITQVGVIEKLRKYLGKTISGALNEASRYQ